MRSLKQQLVSLSTALVLSLAVAAPAYAVSEDIQKAFDEALQQREQGNYHDAVGLLQQIVNKEPSLARARLELALTRFYTLNFQEARGMAEEVLNDPKTPEGVKVTIREFMQRLQDESKKHKWSGSIFVGRTSDDNVNVGAGAGTIGGVTLPATSNPQSDEGTNYNASATHRYLFDKTTKLRGKDVAWMWLTDLAFFRDDYDSENDFDLDVLTVRTGPAFVIANELRGSISLQADHIRLGNTNLANYVSIAPGVSWQYKKAEISLSAEVQDRDYTDQTNDNLGRDSTYKAISAAVAYQINDKVTLSAGVTSFDESAKVDAYSSRGEEYFVGGSWNAWKGGTVSLRYTDKDTKYKDTISALLSVDDRDESYRSTSLGVNHTFQSGRLKNWIVSGYFSDTDNNSNTIGYSYDRQQAGISIGKQWN